MSKPITMLSNAAIVKGRFIQLQSINADGKKVGIHATDGTTATAQVITGISLDSADGAGENIRVMPLGSGEQVTAQGGGVLTPATHQALTCDANGKAVAAGAGDRCLAMFLQSQKLTGVGADLDYLDVILGNCR